MNNKIIFLGLGNFGLSFKKNRHNLGVQFIESWMFNLDIEWTERQNYFLSSTKINSLEILFIKFKNFINLSGESLKKTLLDLNESHVNTIICSDNIDLPFGKIKFYDHLPRNGHKGLNNLRKIFSNFTFTNLEIGIDKKKPIEKWVLSDFTKNEEEILKIKFNNLYIFLKENISLIVSKKQLKWSKVLNEMWGQYKLDKNLEKNYQDIINKY